jgi:hypothetical protein
MSGGTWTCPSCGKQMSSERRTFKFCSDCGTGLKTGARPPQPDERPTVHPLMPSLSADYKKCPRCDVGLALDVGFCPLCGARFAGLDLEEATMQAEAARAQLGELGMDVTFPTVVFLGGIQGMSPERAGTLTFTTSRVHFDSERKLDLDMSTVRSVEIGGGQIAKSKIGATLVFGVLGGLAAKGSEDRAEIVVHLLSGDAAFFFIQRTSPAEVRARLMPLLKSIGVPFKDEADQQAMVDAASASPTASPSLADELVKLAQLHESGFLTDDEVALAKAKLLG